MQRTRDEKPKHSTNRNSDMHNMCVNKDIE